MAYGCHQSHEGRRNLQIIHKGIEKRHPSYQPWPPWAKPSFDVTITSLPIKKKKKNLNIKQIADFINSRPIANDLIIYKYGSVDPFCNHEAAVFHCSNQTMEFAMNAHPTSLLMYTDSRSAIRTLGFKWPLENLFPGHLHPCETTNSQITIV